jgi:hypothetical protein
VCFDSKVKARHPTAPALPSVIFRLPACPLGPPAAAALAGEYAGPRLPTAACLKVPLEAKVAAVASLTRVAAAFLFDEQGPALIGKAGGAGSRWPLIEVPLAGSPRYASLGQQHGHHAPGPSPSDGLWCVGVSPKASGGLSEALRWLDALNGRRALTFAEVSGGAASGGAGGSGEAGGAAVTPFSYQLPPPPPPRVTGSGDVLRVGWLTKTGVRGGERAELMVAAADDVASGLNEDEDRASASGGRRSPTSLLRRSLSHAGRGGGW